MSLYIPLSTEQIDIKLLYIGNDEDIPLWVDAIWVDAIWVDAICINQQDLEERSAQVQLMKKIYQQAEGVIAWIRPEYQLGLRCLKILATEISSLPTPSISLSWLRDLKVDFCGANYKRDSHNSGSGNFWDAVIQFLNIWLYWGNSIRPLQIRKLWENLHQTNLPEKMQDALFNFKVGGIRMILDQYWLKSTDPKGKIYRLLGLVGADIVPDYYLRIGDVYFNFFQYWINKEGTLTFLGVSGTGLLESDSQFNLPSWVPNFVKISPKIGISEASYRADVGHTEEERIIRTERSSLFISGLAVDEISEARKIPSIQGFCTYAWDIATEDDDINKVAMYPTGISRLQALFRVTVGDIDIFNEERPRLGQPGTESFDRLVNAFIMLHTLRIEEAGPGLGPSPICLKLT
ncbi:hypothetical protein BKA61DRAFT_583835 [Leptodontidium sp. MPI-SDFR-AT-0119]|nr:hypothetical protein BKA61DRAFT_583835 [Leptodontidium sp. MPI-SDFR-AT-0119]